MALDAAPEGNNNVEAVSIPPSEQPQMEGPPIITYPEFLAHSSQSPPLITLPQVLATLYTTATTAAAVYGASKYLVQPMAESLDEARRALAQKTLEHLETLNTKLEARVTMVPSGDGMSHDRERLREQDGESVLSHDSDPTELFHVDIGTQTSPFLSRRSSTSTSSPRTTGEDQSVLTTQLSNLETIHTQLASLVGDNQDGGSDDGVMTGVMDLKAYLEGIIYASPATSLNSTPYAAMMGGSSAPKANSSRAGVADVDALNSVKSEIRGIKGVLLNARNFPGGGGRGMPRSV
ncbi:MAG: hypothetical protein M1838_003317, partial [Thelocarpon superellum]